MRFFSMTLVAFCLTVCSQLFAELAITADEAKAQTEFNKAYRVSDKDARRAALGILSGAKHSSSFRLIYGVAANPAEEADIRLAAFEQLAKSPARDASVAHLLAGIFSSLKNTTTDKDEEAVIQYAKALAPVEFKSEVIYAFIARLTALRYQKIPALIQQQSAGGSTDNRRQIEAVKKARKFYEDILEAFNAVAHSEIAAASEDSPKTLKAWYDANASKIATADRELTEKYKKEDTEAAKAAKDAAAKPTK